MSNKWVEVEAKTIDDAIKAGLKELQLDDATEADISILREPEGGVFGVGGTKALVRISVRGGFKNRNGRNCCAFRTLLAAVLGEAIAHASSTPANRDLRDSDSF